MTSEIIRTHWFTYNSQEDDSIRIRPRAISSYEEIPAGFLAAFPGEDAGFPYTVLIPEGGLSPFQKDTNPQMLCLYENRLVSLEAIQGEVQTSEYALKSITSVEHGRVLLNSWMSINSASRNKTLNFSSSFEQVFSPIIKALRATADVQEPDASAAKNQEEITKLGYLWKRNIKYFNYAKQSLAPGATIQASVYQEDIPLSKLNFFNKPVFSSYLSGHLAVLTDREMIFIKESEEIRAIHDTSYGGVFSYIPVDKVKSVDFQMTDDKKVDCVVSIGLVDGKHYQFQYSTATAMQLDAFKEACARTFASV
jgi:hypothetical protein